MICFAVVPRLRNLCLRPVGARSDSSDSLVFLSFSFASVRDIGLRDCLFLSHEADRSLVDLSVCLAALLASSEPCVENRESLLIVLVCLAICSSSFSLVRFSISKSIDPERVARWIDGKLNWN